MHIFYCPDENKIISKWEIKHPKFFGAIVTKICTTLTNSVIEKWKIILPQEYISINIKLWLLSHWNINSESKFQTVYTKTGKDIIFTFSKNIWISIRANNKSCYSQFQITRAIQSSAYKTLGEIIDNLITNPNQFRYIEMGKCYVGALTHPLEFTKFKNSNSLFIGEVSIIYDFGHSQTELENNRSQCFENSILEKSTDLNSEALQSLSFPKFQQLSLHQKRDYLKSSSLFILNSLTSQNGAIIAAPECDPDFEFSGGYGYVWPRDAAFCALALMRCGLYKSAKAILLFLKNVQNHDGDYFQRFDCQNNKAPSWCELQADQLGLVCIAMSEYLKYENDSIIFYSLKKGIHKLINDFAERGSLQNSFDLWEEKYGLHFYSHVCAYGALHRAIKFLPELESQIKNSMQICYEFCTKHLYIDKKHLFARSLDAKHNLDLQADISLLSCIFPISEFPIEHNVKLSIFEYCYEKLTTKAGTLRYENDHYMGGNSWILAGFWMAQAARELSITKIDLKEVAFEIFKKSINLCNETGFFSEQIDSHSGKPIWVMPLAWSHAFYLWSNEDFEFNN